jgi:hypothetical protein
LQLKQFAPERYHPNRQIDEQVAGDYGVLAASAIRITVN